MKRRAYASNDSGSHNSSSCNAFSFTSPPRPFLPTMLIPPGGGTRAMRADVVVVVRPMSYPSSSSSSSSLSHFLSSRSLFTARLMASSLSSTLHYESLAPGILTINAALLTLSPLLANCVRRHTSVCIRRHARKLRVPVGGSRPRCRGWWEADFQAEELKRQSAAARGEGEVGRDVQGGVGVCRSSGGAEATISHGGGGASNQREAANLRRGAETTISHRGEGEGSVASPEKLGG